MNPKSMSETEAIRSDIEMTRQRMDHTMDALSERLHGRHLLDEVIGFFRGGDDGSGTGARIRSKISETAGTASNAVVETVKKNPLPILMITAGAAWLAYSVSKSRKSVFEEVEPNEEGLYDPDTHYDRPLEYPGTASGFSESGMSGMTEESGSKFEQMKSSIQDKASSAKEKVKEKFSGLSESTRGKLHSARERASEIGSRVRESASRIGGQVQERSKQVYSRTRERVSTTADQHPLEVGLGCLAAGVLIGLAIPTPGPVNRVAGPAIDRLKNRTREAGREAMEKGKRVVAAAKDAAKDEAQSQGLTFEHAKEGVERVAEKAGSAASETARQEGLTGSTGGFTPGANVRAGAEPADPSAARPGY